MSKLGLKTGGPLCYFLSTRSQKINEYYKNWAKKIEMFLFTFLVSFFMAFLTQKLIDKINMIYLSEKK